ncbi:SacI homology domain-containing protein [Syncephalis pseudoplumigaleata]|uniref:SacI homology domain-containing protein n=1 Tax=Syncephalis pseudoplumigaleata TaxID=1712513 RepID=A0A4P9YZW0_9FUNG|nr:SacI homology domain-containing protein [Syncephalis pseudoplumigaleata]|eukprot:RKP25548.1 SacI homology domain-containing protein [Syncephalis pseudoplumigaleata]
MMRGSALLSGIKGAAVNAPLIGTLFGGPNAHLTGPTSSSEAATAATSSDGAIDGRRTRTSHDTVDNDSMSESAATLVGTADHPVIASPGGVHKEMQLVVQPDAFMLCARSDPTRWDVVKLSFADAKLTRSVENELPSGTKQYAVYGCIGMMRLHTGPHLIVVIERKHIGRLFGEDIYRVKKVAVLPLDERKALFVLDKLRLCQYMLYRSRRVMSNDTAISVADIAEGREFDANDASELGILSEDEDEDSAETIPSVTMAARMRSTLMGLVRRYPASSDEADEEQYELQSTSTIRMPSGKPPPLSMEFSRDADLQGPASPGTPPPSAVEENAADASATMDRTGEINVQAFPRASTIATALRMLRGNAQNEPRDEKEALDMRVIRELMALFANNGFYLSYGLEITQSLQQIMQRAKDATSTPLWQRLDEWILPVMQGYMHVECCKIESNEFEFVLISRRSRERAGTAVDCARMRYERRGVDESGNVANFVETEQAVFRDNTPHFVSFLQTRGSIPLFWSQSPYRLRPTPIIERTPADNALAFQRHMEQLADRYGPQYCVSLVELQGREAIIGEEYRRYTEQCDRTDIHYREFDFHNECRGMRYENIAKLIEEMDADLARIKYFWSAQSEHVFCQQAGTIRTSAIARHVLNLQLLRLGIQLHPERGIANYESFETVFNHAWANNGDFISREYAGTSALKGDFTRTGRRNFQGMMNDATNSLARLYQNAFRDYFRQATIDYLLGNKNIDVFVQVLTTSGHQLRQQSEEERWMKIRANAIEISSGIVIGEGEMLLNGWTLSSPVTPHTIRDKSYEEKVVLLTQLALYVCSFHYALEKVVEFVRISLDTITEIQRGEYILSTARSDAIRPEDNYGFVVHYRPEGEATRFNSGSMRNRGNSVTQLLGPSTSLKRDPTRFFAFKALSPGIVGQANAKQGQAATATDDEKHPRCVDIVAGIVAEITVACENVGNRRNEDEAPFVLKKPIISLEEALENTSLVSKVGLRLRRVVF